MTNTIESKATNLNKAFFAAYEIIKEDDQRLALTEVMDAAHRLGLKQGSDERMTQVMKWVERNLYNYTDDARLNKGGWCEPLYRLRFDLEEAMNKQEDS